METLNHHLTGLAVASSSYSTEMNYPSTTQALFALVVMIIVLLFIMVYCCNGTFPCNQTEDQTAGSIINPDPSGRRIHGPLPRTGRSHASQGSEDSDIEANRRTVVIVPLNGMLYYREQQQQSGNGRIPSNLLHDKPPPAYSDLFTAPPPPYSFRTVTPSPTNDACVRPPAYEDSFQDWKITLDNDNRFDGIINSYNNEESSSQQPRVVEPLSQAINELRGESLSQAINELIQEATQQSCRARAGDVNVFSQPINSTISSTIEMPTASLRASPARVREIMTYPASIRESRTVPIGEGESLTSQANERESRTSPARIRESSASPATGRESRMTPIAEFELSTFPVTNKELCTSSGTGKELRESPNMGLEPRTSVNNEHESRTTNREHDSGAHPNRELEIRTSVNREVEFKKSTSHSININSADTIHQSYQPGSPEQQNTTSSSLSNTALPTSVCSPGINISGSGSNNLNFIDSGGVYGSGIIIIACADMNISDSVIDTSTYNQQNRNAVEFVEHDSNGSGMVMRLPHSSGGISDNTVQNSNVTQIDSANESNSSPTVQDIRITNSDRRLRTPESDVYSLMLEVTHAENVRRDNDGTAKE